MADIIDSSKQKGQQLMSSFRSVVAKVNQAERQGIRSPLTITLGDEFQGIAKSPADALRILFRLEKEIRHMKVHFRLRFVVHEGEISTKINTKTAHEMLGPGLAEARRQLTAMKTSRHRFMISLADQGLSELLNLGMAVYQGIVDRWTPAQLKVVNAFDQESDYREVAKKVKRDPTVIWRRKRALMIEEYQGIMQLVLLNVKST